MDEQREERQNGFVVLGVVIASLALVAAVIGVGLGVRAVDQSENVSATGGGAATPVALSEFKLDPASITVPSGGRLTVTNDGTAQHNLKVEGTDLATPMIDP